MTKTATKSRNCAPSKNEANCQVPCCEIRIEECAQGCKIYCTCEDEVACQTLQNLCRKLEGCACNVQCTRDGELCCQCCFDCCECKCEMMADGVCICCTTTDKACMKMVQQMCRCLSCCCECGCECTICMDNTPVCHCNC